MKVVAAPSAVLLGVELLLACTSALADIDYAVYFDVNRRTKWPNPFKALGENEWDPKIPRKWKTVDPESWPVFVDWGNVLDNPYWWNKGNDCLDRSDADYEDRHRQSPITLKDDQECEDRHKIFTTERGLCTEGQVKFVPTPYGLSAEFLDCTLRPTIDHSLNRDSWELVHLTAKVPAEHRVEIYGDVEEFVGELQLAFKGSKLEEDEGMIGHAEDIAITSILLKVSNSSDFEGDDELERYIKGWERVQEDQYDNCNVVYDEGTCALSKIRAAPTTPTPTESPTTPAPTVSPTGSPTDQCFACYANDCCDSDRMLEAHGGSSGSFRGRSEEANRKLDLDDGVAALVKEQRMEIKRLQRELSKLQGNAAPDMRRELGKWDYKCTGSDYCPVNLYKHTKTDFYHRYRGSLTVPPCTENVHWRCLINPLFISKNQLERLERLTYRHLDETACKLTTVGKPRNDGTCRVDVNRPLQTLSYRHDLKQCDAWSEGAIIPEDPENEPEGYNDLGDRDEDDEDDKDEKKTKRRKKRRNGN